MLLPHEPPAVEVVNPDGHSRALLVCDHASNRLPASLGTLGLAPGEVDTHIGWDIGAAAVARHLSRLLDATLVLSGYSRLVVDCNRPTQVAGSIPEVTCGVPVPGNAGLSPGERQARIQTFFRPYHTTIESILEERLRHPGRATPVLLSIHSFTPELYGNKRPWQIGLLYGKDSRLAHAFRDWLRRDPSLTVGDNEPYRVSADTDHTIPTHGEARAILHTAFEIRQDGVTGEAGQRAWAERLAAGWDALGYG